MKKTIMISALALLMAASFTVTTQAAVIIIEDQVTSPAISIVKPNGSITAGTELKIINRSNHSVLFSLNHGQSAVLVKPATSEIIKVDKAGTYPYELHYGRGPGLTSPSVPTTMKGELVVQ
jgi:hypothetical protein